MTPGEPEKIRDYKDLEVWRVGMDLVRAVYCATACMPRMETYGLAAQMRGAAVSIPSNIAEGYERGSRAEYSRFVKMARGSAAELETQVLLARDLAMLDAESAGRLLDLLGSVRRMLWGLTRALDGGQRAQ